MGHYRPPLHVMMNKNPVTEEWEAWIGSGQAGMMLRICDAPTGDAIRNELNILGDKIANIALEAPFGEDTEI